MKERSMARMVRGLVGLLLVALLAGCGSGTVVTALELVTAASEAAVSTLEAAGQITPGTAIQIDSYLANVSAATQFAATELQSTDTTALKVSKIAAQFAGIAVPNLPPGTAQAIVTAIQAVANAVSKFLVQIQPPPAPSAKLPVLAFSSKDQVKLEAIRSRAEVVHQKVTKR